MSYKADDFAKLVRMVEKQGGSQLPEPCTGTPFAIEQPLLTGGFEPVPVDTQHCGNFSLFAVPYDPEPGSDDDVGYVTACAVDDSMNLWPRFRSKRR